MSDLITAEAVSVVRDGEAVLRNVSLNIGSRDFLTVIGPNGGGKSMLLKCLMGFYEPDQGQVRRSADLKIGYVPQRLVPDPSIPITVLRFLKLRKKASAAALEAVTFETEIEASLSRPLSVLSGGELQRVLLARALLDAPNLLVLDEPAQNLDVVGQVAFYELLERVYADRKISVLMVSHDLHLVMSTTHQIICLSKEIRCSGTPASVAIDPAFTDVFGQDMAQLMSCYITHDHSMHPQHKGATHG